MRLAGLQKLSLLDYPGRVAAVVFTQGCPFRCVYCHNPGLIAPLADRTLAEEDVVDFLRKRRGFLDGVVVTGGEPTVHPDLPRFLARLKGLGFEVKLDTNGVHPRTVERILRERLVDLVAMDLKHVWRKYEDVIGAGARAAVANCRETMGIIRASDVAREFRTTVYPALHAEEDLIEIAEELGAGDRYALQAVRYGTTYDQDLPRVPGFDLEAVAERIRAARPGLRVEVRT